MFTNNLKLGVTVTITRRKGSMQIHWHATAGVCQRPWEAWGRGIWRGVMCSMLPACLLPPPSSI